MPSIKVKDEQCLIDVAMQEVGTIEAVFTLALSNEMSITDDVQAGESIVLVPVVDIRIISAFKDNGLFPASNTASDEIEPDGIGYMIITLDFIVS